MNAVKYLGGASESKHEPSAQRLHHGRGLAAPARAARSVFATKVPFEIYDSSFIGKMAHDELGSQKVFGSGSQFDFLWEDGAFAKTGHNNQGLYIDPAREFVGVYFSTSTLPNYPIGYMRAAALSLS